MDDARVAQFQEFCHLETAAGGPDPHLALAARAARDGHLDQQRHALFQRDRAALAFGIWRACCYVAPYEVSTGSVLWTAWADPRYVLSRPEALHYWVDSNWSKIQFRRERRAARSKPKFTECLLSAAKFATTAQDFLQEQSYEEVWARANKELRFMGRYAIIKLLETLYRANLMRDPVPDIRPRGAWSPRLTLSWLYPEHSALLNDGGDSPKVLAQIQELAEQVRGPQYSMWQHEVLLCNFRQNTEGRTPRYPGISLDSDLKYYREAQRRWADGVPLPFYDYRAALFPHRGLGELQGWDGPRVELGETFTKHGYFWSDLLYDYHQTVKENTLANPVRRS